MMTKASPSTSAVAQREAILNALVARFNASPYDPDRRAVERWLREAVNALDSAKLGDRRARAELTRRFDRWLETGGKVGGPEQEQDPTRPHPRGWHGNQ
jgi:hypothetical protein